MTSQPTGAGRRIVTVLFADLEGSTDIGDQLDPEALSLLMDRYFELVSAIVRDHGGTIEKYIGDAVMAIFGVPRLHEDDALRATRAASEIVEAVTSSSEGGGAIGPRLDVRVGLNTGEVFVNLQTEPGQRLVTGDTVNVSYRLQEVAHGGQVVMSSSTYELVRDRVRVGPVEQFHLRGKSSLVSAYRLERLGSEVQFVRSSASLIGRRRELGRIRTAFEDAVADKSCQLFTIIGSAGVGKSRLAWELERLLRTRATFVRGRCLSYGQGITYWPIAEIVRSAVGIAPDDTHDTARDHLNRFLTEAPDGREIASRVAQVIGLEPGTYPRDELYWSVRRLLEVRAAERPLVAIVDDIHWAEPSLLDLLDYIAETGRNHALFLLCLTRPDLLEHRPGWGGGKHNATSLVLEPFGNDRADQLLTSLAGSSVPPDVATRITYGAEGNPLFIEEMFRMLVDSGSLRRETQGWVTDRSRDRRAVPSTIQALLAARLDQLEPTERLAAQTASVVGRSFDVTTVAGLLGESGATNLLGDVQALVKKEILRAEDETGPTTERFRFRHDLIRDAAYESLWKLDRAVLHERLADHLETVMVGRVAEYDAIIGHHLDQAFRYRIELGLLGPEVDVLARRAGRWLARAGHAANERRDVAAAAELLSRAIDLLQQDDPAWLEALIDYGDVAGSQGDYSKAGALLSDAVVLASDRDPALSRRARLYHLYWRGQVLGAPAATVREVEELVEELIAAGDDKTASQALLFLAGDVHADQGRLTEARAIVKTAQMHAERSGDHDASAECLRQLVHLGVRDLTPCTEVLRECRQLLDTPGLSLGTRANTLEALCVLLGMRGEFDEARAAAQEASRIDGELGNTKSQRYRGLALGLIEQFAGNPVRAEAAFHDAYDAAQAIRASLLPFLAARLALPTLLLGRDDEAWALTEEAEADDTPWTRILLRGVRARILARRGRFAEAIDLAQTMLREAHDDGFEEVPNIFAAALENAAAVMRDAGRPDDERLFLEDAISRYDAKENVAAARLARESMAEIARTPA